MRKNISKKLKRAIQLEIKYSIVMRDYDKWQELYEENNSRLENRVLKADERYYDSYLDLNESEKEYMNSRNWYPKECETYEEALEYYK